MRRRMRPRQSQEDDVKKIPNLGSQVFLFCYLRIQKSHLELCFVRLKMQLRTVHLFKGLFLLQAFIIVVAWVTKISNNNLLYLAKYYFSEGQNNNITLLCFVGLSLGSIVNNSFTPEKKP